MTGLRSFFMVADPLIVAFIVSVFIGAVFKRFSGILILKYSATTLSALGYLMLYVYADSVSNSEILRYIVMFAPIALILVVIVISIIIAPKGEIEDDEMGKEHQTKKFLTGWESMFPNDIDEYDKHPK